MYVSRQTDARPRTVTGYRPCQPPYEDEDGLNKPYGFVLDFVGIFEQLEKALAFDSDEVNAVIKNVEVLERLFATLMTETAPQYLPLTQGFDDKAKEFAIEAFAEKETREKFFKFFRQLQTLYDVLSPNPRLYLSFWQAYSSTEKSGHLRLLCI